MKHQATLTVAVPTTVFWERGIRVAPYVRALPVKRPAVVMVAGVQAARIYTYDAGALGEAEKVKVPITEREVYHMGDAAPSGFSPNTRGRAGKDEHDRDHVAAIQKLASELVEQIRRHAGDVRWIILFGIPQLAHAVKEKLPGALAARTLIERAEFLEWSEKTIAEATAAAVNVLERQRQATNVASAIEERSREGVGWSDWV